MTTIFIADTGVFVRCGGSDNDKFQRLRRSLRQADTTLHIPQRVYEELGGDPDVDEYPSSNIPYPHGFEEGWIIVADDLDYSNPLVSTVMDEARRFIATETDRDEDRIEKADTALVGLAAQFLDSGPADDIILWTTDKPAGRAARTLLSKHGFEEQIHYQYISEEFLTSLTASTVLESK